MRSSVRRTGGFCRPSQVATSSGAEGPNARRWHRTASVSASVSASAEPAAAPPAGAAGAARYADGVRPDQTPSAGARTRTVDV
jgi:hypothetical protein